MFLSIAYTPLARHKEAHVCRTCIKFGCLGVAQAEFVPSELVKVHGSQEDRCWRYLMSWKRTSVGEPEVSTRRPTCAHALPKMVPDALRRLKLNDDSGSVASGNR